ncbi:S-adenosyl-L-methionine:benzoic acid/salicylic acid carboxyl methyltransferase 1 isoform X2 [Ziziphus jujuba]|uniref:S-adenosyl-L-methionine:benzoic acid/salicylic acid carboxyl methyltransferase 1 isoform X2 n=1 Tax=Ziziphus jujuba TaxID=326968 RepID=A0A6P3YVY0_ZIZJJ|nr:S-adenosyl-L-methionine:benzoic acid/salicylic acid carboxyl methyltransferase 1 isoform X2 [Ziziphus jujuba]
MDADQVLHMNGGEGMISYSNNSLHQVFLNDLPGNDFNTLFKSYKKLEEEKGGQDQGFGKCFISTVPGSFYGRLFPSNSLHFVHSSYSLMWLSKVPKSLVSASGQGVVNKGNVCVAKTSPPAVHKAYLEEFQSGFTKFLKFRAQELVPGGSMVLTTMGSIKSDDPLSIWECVGLNLNDMVSEGLIEEEKLDVLNLPYYAASKEEVQKLIEEEGSFELKNLEVFKMDWDTYLKKANSKLDEQQRAAIITSHIRAVGEPFLAAHFGEAAMDELFSRFKDNVLHHMVWETCEYVNLVISLTKKL